MNFEILLSDTAREDLEQLAADSPERARVQNLLDRIGAGAVSEDHVLSAPESQFELRYLSFETTYIFFRRDAGAQQATVIYFCEMNVPPPAAPAYRILDWKSRDIPQGMEIESSVEFTRADGSSKLIRQFARKIDMGDTYTHFQHIQSGNQPAVTMIITGKKGVIEGDVRRDEIEMIALQQDGTVRRFPPITTPVSLNHPLAGLPPEQMFARMAEYTATPEFRARFEAARKWFELG